METAESWPKVGCVSYYRVSTDRQGKSGLGLEAPWSTVTDYPNGGDWTLPNEFVEVVSGKRADRPELAKALDSCRREKATLIIAKLDRLAGNVVFIARDLPDVNRSMPHIMFLHGGT